MIRVALFVSTSMWAMRFQQPPAISFFPRSEPTPISPADRNALQCIAKSTQDATIHKKDHTENVIRITINFSIVDAVRAYCRKNREAILVKNRRVSLVKKRDATLRSTKIRLILRRNWKINRDTLASLLCSRIKFPIQKK